MLYDICNSFEMAIENLEDIAMDVPKAPLYLSAMIKKLTSEGVLSAEQVSTLIKATDLIQDLDITREASLLSPFQMGISSILLLTYW
jgi:hypothetical protein